MEQKIEQCSLALISRLPKICKPNEFMVAYFIINTMSMEKKDRIKMYRGKLADLCNMTERNISRITERLNQIGIITKELIGDAEKKKTFNYYRLNWQFIAFFLAKFDNEESTFLPELSHLKKERIEEYKEYKVIKEYKENNNILIDNKNNIIIDNNNILIDNNNILIDNNKNNILIDNNKNNILIDNNKNNILIDNKNNIIIDNKNNIIEEQTESSTVEDVVCDNTFFNYIDKTLQGTTEEELITRKGKILRILNGKKLSIGENLFNRISSYLNTKYQEELELVYVESR